MGEEVTVPALPPESPARPGICCWRGKEEKAGMGCWRSRVSRKYLFHNAVTVVLQGQGQDGI